MYKFGVRWQSRFIESDTALDSPLPENQSFVAAFALQKVMP